MCKVTELACNGGEQPHTSFPKRKQILFCIDTFNFDSELRSLVFNALQHIEIASRTKINQHFAVRPKITSRMRQRWITNFNFPIDRLYPQLCCIAYWLNSINPQNTFVQDLKFLLTKYPSVQPSMMGFPRGWENEPLWQ